MKRIALILVLLLFFIPSENLEAQDTINWIDITELEAAVADDPKPVFIDVYTDWCGWCKRMDATTFEDPEIIKVLNEKFHTVKLDGEFKGAITFKEQEFKFVRSGRRGYHELALAFMGKLSYPTFVFLDSELGLLQPLPGYRTSKEMLPILEYLGGSHYLQTEWETFMNEWDSARNGE